MATRLIQPRACPASRLWSHALVALMLGAMMASCAFDPPSIQRTPREATVEPNAKSRIAARRGGPAKGAEAGAPDGADIAVPGEEVAALEVDLTNFRERLIGLDSDEINDLMGSPGLERNEPPALIWQYRGAACTVDIFMFDDGAGPTVDTVEVRGAQNAPVDEKACFTALLRDPNAIAKPGAAASPGVAPAPSAAPSKPVQRGGVAPARTTPQSTPPAAARSPRPAAPAAPATPAAPKAPQMDFEDDDGGAPPAGADAKTPAAAPAPPAAKPEFEIEDDPDKLGPVRNEDDPAARNEDLVE